MSKIDRKQVLLLPLGLLVCGVSLTQAKPAAADGTIWVGYNPDYPGCIECKAVGTWQMGSVGPPEWGWYIDINGSRGDSQDYSAPLNSYVNVNLDTIVNVGSGTYTVKYVGNELGPPSPVIWWSVTQTVVVP